MKSHPDDEWSPIFTLVNQEMYRFLSADEHHSVWLTGDIILVKQHHLSPFILR